MLVGALWLIWAAGGAAQAEHGGPAARPSPTSPVAPGATPTIDRLAAPPTAASPNQADEGAQLFWLHCQPCHGDQGQGLTDDWRAQYPPDDQNCWESGCHGPRPYGEGFILPTAVPAVIGDGALAKFETIDAVYEYVSVTMPYFFPGDLTQAEYLAIVAHLARENGLWDGRTLTTDNLAGYRLRPLAAAAATATAGHLARPTAASPAVAPPAAPGIGGVEVGLIGVGALAALLAIGGVWLWRNRSR